MAIEIEHRIEELCELAAKEHDSTKLKSFIEQLIECVDARRQKREVAKTNSASGERSTEKQEVANGNVAKRLWSNQLGQDIAEYGVILAVIPVLVVGTVRLVGSHHNNVFSSLASSVH